MHVRLDDTALVHMHAMGQGHPVNVLGHRSRTNYFGLNVAFTLLFRPVVCPMQRSSRLAQPGLSLLCRAFSAAAEPAQALRPQEDGIRESISVLKQRLAEGVTTMRGWRCDGECRCVLLTVTMLASWLSLAGPDLGDFIKGTSDLDGYSVHAPRPKVHRRLNPAAATTTRLLALATGLPLPCCLQRQSRRACIYANAGQGEEARLAEAGAAWWRGVHRHQVKAERIEAVHGV